MGATVTAISSIIGGISSAANAITQAKVADESIKSQKKQLKMAQDAQDAQADEIKRMNDEALAKRKGLIDTQRKQMPGAGDDYSVNQTSSMGVDPSMGSIMGTTLG
jgi:hypothetical protein